MLTLNQIISQLRTIRENHAQLNSFYFGDPFEMGASESEVYPIMGAALLPGTLAKRQKSTKLLLYVADLVNKDESNENEVLSDTELIILDVYAQLWEYLEENAIELSPDATFSSFTEEWDDEVSGWQIEINLNQFYSRDTCQVPEKDPDIIPPVTPYISTSLTLDNGGVELQYAEDEESPLFYFIGEGFCTRTGTVTITTEAGLELWNGSAWLPGGSSFQLNYTEGRLITEKIYKIRMPDATAFAILGGTVDGCNIPELSQIFATI